MSRILVMAALVLVAIPAQAAAQDQPEILAELSQSRIYEGQSVVYRVTLNHVENPPPPELKGFDDFDVRSMGEQSLDSTQITIINGRMTKIVRRGREYRYQLTPRKTGRLRVPAPVARVGGQMLTGPELVLDVVPADQQDVVFLEVTADRQSVYPLKPFTVTVTVAVKGLPAPFTERNPVSVQRELRRRQPALRIPWIDESLPDGLEAQADLNTWARPLLTGQPAGFSINELATGRSSFFSIFDDRELASFLPKAQKAVRRDNSGQPADYWEYAFSRTFTARKIGQFTFGPVTLEGVFVVGVNQEGEASVEQIYAVGRPIQVTCTDVPQAGRPETYIGAVGRFEVDATLTPTQAKVDDPMTLTVTVSGQGTLENAFAPDLAGMPEIAEKFRIFETSQETQGGSCRFTYGLRPKDEGIEAFPPIPVSYFDVESERYVTVRTDPIPIEISRVERLSDDQIVAAPGGPSSGRREVEVRRGGIFANLTDVSAVRDESVRPARWLLGLGGLAGLYAVVALAAVQIRRRSSDKALLRRRGAVGKARARLKQALTQLQTHQFREGADLVQDALVGLAADVADLPEAGLTPKDVCGQLEALGLEEDLVGRVRMLLETCDAARYGAAAQSAGLGQEAQHVLDQVIRSLKAKRRFR